MAIVELSRRFEVLYLPSVCDALYELGMPEQVLPTYLRPLNPFRSFAGEAFTVLGKEIDPPVSWDEGVGRIRSYLDVFEHLTAGSVLVSKTEGHAVGHFGELTANAALRNGCSGIILDGNLRDVAGIREIEFPVVYRSLSPRNGIGRWEMVGSQIPITIGDIVVNPGDVVVAEFEGVIVIPRQSAEEVLERTEAIAAAEGRVRTEIRAGATPSASLDRHGHI